MNLIKQIAHWVDHNLEETMVVIALAMMTTLIFFQTTSRIMIGNTPYWTQELAQFIQVYFVYIAATYAIKKDAHVRITLIKNILPQFLHKFFELVGYIGFFCFSMILLIWGTSLCLEIKGFNQLTSALQIPMFIPYLAVPLGGLAMSIRLIQRMIILFKG